MYLCDQICMTAVSSLLPALTSRGTLHLHKSWDEARPPMCWPLQRTPTAGGFMATWVDINNLIHGMLFQGWNRSIQNGESAAASYILQDAVQDLLTDSSLVSLGITESLCLFLFVFFLKKRPYLWQGLECKTCGFAVLKRNSQFSFIWPSFMKSSL